MRGVVSLPIDPGSHGGACAGAQQSLLPASGRLYALADPIRFVDESPDDPERDAKAPAPWVVLIVDDDKDVHDATELALCGERIIGRPFELRHAYSAAEARRMLAASRDISVVLLDVVMETPDAGLKLAQAIRMELARDDVKIILRTGQPGQIPESDIRRDLAIDGYLNKASLTRGLLLEALVRALDAGRDAGTAAQH